MELVEGKAYLVEVWETPPEYECNGQEARKAILRFDGYYSTSGGFMKHIVCDGKVLDVNYNKRMERWTSVNEDMPMYAWRAIPLRMLEQETEYPDPEPVDGREDLPRRIPEPAGEVRGLPQVRGGRPGNLLSAWRSVRGRVLRM